jgi:hypothetical protein
VRCKFILTENQEGSDFLQYAALDQTRFAIKPQS